METVIPFYAGGIISIVYHPDFRQKHGLFPTVEMYFSDGAGGFYKAATPVTLKGIPTDTIIIDTGGQGSGIIVIK